VLKHQRKNFLQKAGRRQCQTIFKTTERHWFCAV